MKKTLSAIDRVEKYKREMTDTLVNIVGIKAVSPESGGEGEGKRADFLEGMLKEWGLRPKRYEYLDDNNVKRPSLVVKYGDKNRTVWVMAHTDTVGEGERSMWKTDPFKGIFKGGKVYGRGSQDDGQGIIASMYALRALVEENSPMRYSFGLALVADEEIGSGYGCQKLVKENIFKKGTCS
ncbi:putative metallohydrolase [uncultured archaeon]|nr:putative metallohydrolase [uncultured archaeon]